MILFSLQDDWLDDIDAPAIAFRGVLYAASLLLLNSSLIPDNSKDESIAHSIGSGSLNETNG